MSMIRIGFFAALVVCLMLFSGCINVDRQINEQGSLAQTDSRGKVIALESPPTRIVSIAPSNTEILFALGLDDEIVGVSDYCNYPEQALEKEKIGGFSTPSIEKIVSLNPDIVFATGGVQLKSVETLEGLGIKVYVSDAKSIDEIMEEIRKIGELTGKTENAITLTNSMQARIDQVMEKTNGTAYNDRPSVFVEIWNDPLRTAGRKTFVYNLIELAGGKNALTLEEDWSLINPEAVIEANPEVILLTHTGSIEEVKNRSGWSTISAVRNEKISHIENDIVVRAGPRIVQALEEIAKVLHPELFSDEWG